MSKFFSGFSSVRGADSRINFRPAGLEIALRIRYKNLYQPLGAIVQSSRTALKLFELWIKK